MSIQNNQKSKGKEWATQLSSSPKEHNGNEMKIEPPRCIQNAMLTKDKKPFTYTPGGIDLSEIRSPHMARRLELNAQSEGTSSTREMSVAKVKNSPSYLPPSALAAMQPALPVQVLPRIAAKNSQALSPKINGTQSSYSEHAAIINTPSHSHPPPAPPLPLSSKNVATKTNVVPKLVSPKSELHDQYEKPQIQKNVRFESIDGSTDKKEPNFEFKKYVVPQNVASYTYASPILLNLNKSPTPWVPKICNDIRETVIPPRMESNNLHEQTVLCSTGNVTKKEIANVKSEQNEHIIPVKLENFSNNTNLDFKTGQKNGNNENTDRAHTTPSRTIPIEVEEGYRNQSCSPQISPSGSSGTRRKIPSLNPIQSRSFRILQKITDSYDDVNNNNNNEMSGGSNVCGIKNTSLSNKFENQRRSNTHSPALDMYEDKIRCQQQMNYGKAYQILHHGDDACDTPHRIKLDALLKNGKFHDFLTKTTTKQNENFDKLSVSNLKPKQNGGNVNNTKNYDFNKTNGLIENQLGVFETEPNNSMATREKSDPKNAKKPHKKYEGGKTHSRLLYLVT